MAQVKQREWLEQWRLVRDDERFLFEDWIHPSTLDDFRGRDVLEAGCGGGQHTEFVASLAKHITAVDLNAVEVARERNSGRDNVEFIEADIGSIDLGRRFDVVFSIGVVHHTDDPDAVVANLCRHLRPGGRLLLWVYSHEGNFLVRNVVDPLRRAFLARMERARLLRLSRVVTSALYPPIHSVYRLPLGFLPYHDYFRNFRRLSFSRNVLNVFDKLNAPQTQFITRARAEDWLTDNGLVEPSITPYCGVSWRISGRAPEA